MKIIIPFILLLLFTHQQDSFWLDGKYKVVPDPNVYEKEYVIIFQDSTYKKVMSDGKEIHGVVQYGKNLIYLRDFERGIKMIGNRIFEVQTERLKEDLLISFGNQKKDTINYCWHNNIKGGPVNWLHICRSPGKLIKVE